MTQMTQKKRFIPIWVFALISLEIVAIFGVTVIGIQDIAIMHPDQSGSSYLASLYITRNLVALAGLAMTTYVFRSYIALFVMLASRIATEISDFAHSYLYGRGPEYMAMLPYLIVLMVVVPIIALMVLWPDVRREIATLKRTGACSG